MLLWLQILRLLLLMVLILLLPVASCCCCCGCFDLPKCLCCFRCFFLLLSVLLSSSTHSHTGTHTIQHAPFFLFFGGEITVPDLKAQSPARREHPTLVTPNDHPRGDPARPRAGDSPSAPFDARVSSSKEAATARAAARCHDHSARLRIRGTAICRRPPRQEQRDVIPPTLDA